MEQIQVLSPRQQYKFAERIDPRIVTSMVFDRAKKHGKVSVKTKDGAVAEYEFTFKRNDAMDLFRI